ncbi:MAG: DUF58 domain-containing protein [Candidatus Obscuribacterales bacterium]|nr:DUF58 domain-containing protein [Candidatus Obscuribacterales bacterium]
MRLETEAEISEILTRVIQCPIPIDWKAESPIPGMGDRKSTYRGAGTDFYELDRYRPGDDARTIDWMATAATGWQTTLRTVYQEEKHINAYVLVDVGHSMNFGTVRTTKRYAAAEMAGTVFYSVDKTRDRAGITVFTPDGVLDSLSARAAMPNVYEAMALLLEADANDPQLAQGSGDGLAKALSTLPMQRSLVFVVTDFMNMSETDWRELGEASVTHDVICIYMQDRRERELPQVGGTGFLGGLLSKLGCAYTIEDHRGNRRTIWNNARTRKRYAENFRKHESGITAQLDKIGCQWMVISTEEGDAAIPKILTLFGTHC